MKTLTKFVLILIAAMAITQMAEAQEPNSEGCRILEGALFASLWTLEWGECKDGWAHGYGKAHPYDTRSDAIYEGQFVEGKFHGKGTLTFSDGVTYTGDWHESRRHGRGIQTSRDVRLDGQWSYDIFMEGQGTREESEGWVFTGQWRDGKPVDTEGTWSFSPPRARSPNALYVHFTQLEAQGQAAKAEAVLNYIIQRFPRSRAATKARRIIAPRLKAAAQKRAAALAAQQQQAEAARQARLRAEEERRQASLRAEEEQREAAAKAREREVEFKRCENDCKRDSRAEESRCETIPYEEYIRERWPEDTDRFGHTRSNSRRDCRIRSYRGEDRCVNDCWDTWKR